MRPAAGEVDFVKEYASVDPAQRRTYMPKFTREELIAAHKQIIEEQKEELMRAGKAAEWLCGKSSLITRVMHRPYSTGLRKDVPYLHEYVLVMSYDQYDLFNEWLEERLQAPEPGIHRNEKGFWLTLGEEDGFPNGTRYYCYTEYYDAHASGY